MSVLSAGHCVKRGGEDTSLSRVFSLDWAGVRVEVDPRSAEVRQRTSARRIGLLASLRERAGQGLRPCDHFIRTAGNE